MKHIEPIDEGMFFEQSVYEGHDIVKTKYTLLAEKINEIAKVLNSLTEKKAIVEKWDREAENLTETKQVKTEKKIPVECEHDYVKCMGKICTSDLHTHHCKKCGKHAFNPSMVEPEKTAESWIEELKRQCEIRNIPYSDIKYLFDECLASHTKEVVEKIRAKAENDIDGISERCAYNQALDDLLASLEDNTGAITE